MNLYSKNLRIYATLTLSFCFIISMKWFCYFQAGNKCRMLDPCQNNGVCEESCDSAGYKCTCDEFHYGQNCQDGKGSFRPRLREIGSKWIRTQTVTDRPCVYTGPDGSEPIWICYPYPNGIAFESDPVWIRSQKGLL